MLLGRRWFLLGLGVLGLSPLQAEALVDQHFDSDGVPIRYVEEGQGEPVILLHGYTSDIETEWVRSDVLPALAAHYRVLALDARGHGRSGKPHDPAQYGPEMGRDITRLMDHLGIRRAHIIGYSMGAHVVAQLLTQQPERFATAVLGGASGRRNWTEEDQKRVEIEAAEMEQGLLTSQIRRLWPRDQPPPDVAQLREASARALAGKDPRALAAVRRSNPAQVVTEAQMAAVTVPTLGIVGTADPYLADFERLRRVMPQLELVRIEGATHGTALSRPEFVASILSFLHAHPGAH
jgi:pimeloyl-ACP methyl ester carboxylesterase